MSYHEMAELEPALLEIESAALQAVGEENHWRTYERLKRRLRSLVGFGARCPKLATSDAWETACRHLEDLLRREPL